MVLSVSELQQAITHLRRGDWQTAHQIVQKDEDSPLACWAHGIVHLMEGDLSNAGYWYRQAGRPFPKDASAEREIGELSAEVEK
jgi:hypothetical protein